MGKNEQKIALERQPKGFVQGVLTNRNSESGDKPNGCATVDEYP